MRTLLSLTLLFGLAGTAHAAVIAGAGECARSDDESLRIGVDEGEAESGDSGAAGPLAGGPAGPARHRFLPTTVGAGGGGPSLGPPSPGAPASPGACSSAGSVCVGAVQPNPNPPVVTRTVRPRSRPSVPILVDPKPDGGCGPGVPCSNLQTPVGGKP